MGNINVHHVYGAGLADDIFEITLETGERILWNITKLAEAARAGEFGAPRYAQTGDLPAARWDTWGSADRATVDWMKANPAILEDPAIAIASPNPDYLICCFADGQHRVTARQELGLAEIIFYIVPLELERAFRVVGL